MTKHQTEFNFAGFTWPRDVAVLPAGALAQRLAASKRPRMTSGYYHSPQPNSNNGRGFYLDSQGMPSPRWDWCDDIDADISHTGWHCDQDGDGTIRGLVLRLPHGRYLAGWSMGTGMASAVDPEVYEDEKDAAQRADHLAQTAAQHEREYQDSETERLRLEEEQEREALAELAEVLATPMRGAA